MANFNEETPCVAYRNYSVPMSTAQLALFASNQGLGKSEGVAAEWGLKTFELGNRRYLGGKTKLIGFIESETQAALGRMPRSIFDVFAGTGVVAQHFHNKGIPIVASDLLRHNYLGLTCFMGPQKLNLNSLAEKIVHLSKLRGKKNYFSENFGGTYFSLDNAKKIGSIREEIEQISTSQRERAALITSLVYAADRVANTVGHYDAFHRGQNIDTPIELKFPLIGDSSSRNNEIYCGDSTRLASGVMTEVAYLDPPYNSRQYSDAYHLLENLAEWQKPEVEGVAKKMDRTHLKSDFCGKSAPEAFEELIGELNTDLIMMSYNNTSDSLNARSNAAISDEEIMDTLQMRGTVTIREVAFNSFTTGKTKKRPHSERLFICKVKNQ